MYDFIRGFMTLPRGISFLLSHRSLWGWVLVPALINIAAMAGSLYFSFHYTASLLERWLPGDVWYSAALGVLGDFIAFVISLLISIVAFIAAATVLAGPFNDWLGVETRKVLHHRAAGEQGFWANMATAFRGLVEAFKEVVFFLAISAGLFVLGLVPAVGAVAPFIAVPFMWYSLAFATITPCMSDRDLSFREKRTVMRANRWAVFGFGSACFVMFFILYLLTHSHFRTSRSRVLFNFIFFRHN